MELLEKLLTKFELIWGFVGAGLVGAGLQLLRTPDLSRSRRAYEAISAVTVSVICGLVATEYLPNKPGLIIAACLASSLSGSKIIDWLQDKGAVSLIDTIVSKLTGRSSSGSATPTTVNVNVNPTPQGTDIASKAPEAEHKISEP
jgi:hypothetical protein